MTTGYGQDTWCFDSLQPGRLSKGVTNLAASLYRRMITPRGTLRGGDEELNGGLDVAGYVGAVGVDIAIAALPALLAAEFRKDQRVVDAAVTVTKIAKQDGTIDLDIRCDILPEDAAEAFSFTVAANTVSVSQLRLST